MEWVVGGLMQEMEGREKIGWKGAVAGGELHRYEWSKNGSKK